MIHIASTGNQGVESVPWSLRLARSRVEKERGFHFLGCRTQLHVLLLIFNKRAIFSVNITVKRDTQQLHLGTPF